MLNLYWGISFPKYPMVDIHHVLMVQIYFGGENALCLMKYFHFKISNGGYASRSTIQVHFGIEYVGWIAEILSLEMNLGMTCVPHKILEQCKYGFGYFFCSFETTLKYHPSSWTFPCSFNP